jgi:glutathione S-transferase
MKLLYTTRSPYARKIQIMAIEKNIALTLIEENLAHKSAELLAANPLGKIPALILDNGETLFDSPVICDYIDSLNNNPILIPQDKRFQLLRWQALADGLMDSTVAIFFEKVRHPEHFNQQYLDAQNALCHAVLTYCENNIAQLNEFSLASISVASALGYLQFRLPEIDISLYPQLTTWYKTISQRPSLQATIPSI